MQDDPDAAKILQEKFNQAGGRLGVSNDYRNAAYQNMRRAYYNLVNGGEFGGGVGHNLKQMASNLPFAVVQAASAPLMEYAIPRVKLGAWLDLADAKLARLGPDASSADRQRVMAEAWDSIDNRFGLLTHDNLFWNKTMSDLMQMGTRSVGWNLGTIRELGGGVRDLAGGNVSSRAAYAMALPVGVGILGAVYQYLHTGAGPQSAVDYFYPKNGLQYRGNDDRVSLPTYMRDVVSYSSNPPFGAASTIAHKASPLLSLAADIGTNRDFFDDMVRNPDDPKAFQFEQMGRHIASQFIPFSVQMGERVGQDQGATPELKAEQYAGLVTRAPARFIRGEDEEAAMSAKRRGHPFTPKTPEQNKNFAFGKYKPSELAKLLSGDNQ